MTLSIATPDDFKRIHGLLMACMRASIYDGMVTETAWEGSIALYLNPDTLKERIALIVEEDGKDVGLAMFEIIPLAASDFLVARFVAIYLEEDYRGKGIMDQIFEAFEYWGKRAGAKYYSIGVSREGVDISNRGYKQYEVMYMKEVN